MTSTPTGARQNNDPSRTTQLRIPPQPRTAGRGLLITAAPIFGWRYTVHAEKKQRRGGPPSQDSAPAPHPAHAPQEKPHWVSDDQTVQIALGGRNQ
ncbi:hypothetical protein OH809_27500 [Streptomyces sp. NBC_00873]|uniref:hypothetical protein n=1 Tax=unclassified Streptomyces TaxID=2593676 RepID=UPI003870E2FE|nr:hypothetical protein OH809_27500 [Streptomyces sp. NBC_00873]WTA43960.1 hypothetical protein OH821_16180 [Streptomyces sp. NBC_00842]